MNITAHSVSSANTTNPSEPEPSPKLYDCQLANAIIVILSYSGFWEWMYPPMAGEENVEMAALGVLILWFSWYVYIHMLVCTYICKYVCKYICVES